MASAAAAADGLSAIQVLTLMGDKMAKLLYRWYKRSRLTYFNSSRREAQEIRNHIDLMEKACSQ